MVTKPSLITGFMRNTKVQERKLKLSQLCSGTLLGTGLVQVVDRDGETPSQPELKLTLSWYNPSHSIQKNLIGTISMMMKGRMCLSETNPLFAAVDSTLINCKTLAPIYGPSGTRGKELQVASFTGVLVEVNIFNRRQCVHMTRSSYGFVHGKVEEMRGCVAELERQLSMSEGQVTGEAKQQMKARLFLAAAIIKYVQIPGPCALA